MSEDSFNTFEMHDYIDRWRAGDLTGRDELIHRTTRRLDKLTRKMFAKYGAISRWTEVEDVLQNAILRLIRALENIRPSSTREFFALAATQVRRELIDLTRHFTSVKRGEGQASNTPDLDDSHFGLEDHQPTREHLEWWASFHQAIEDLPVAEREVFSLGYYHGWTQIEIAAFLHLHERTVRRHWKAAGQRLAETLGPPPT